MNNQQLVFSIINKKETQSSQTIRSIINSCYFTILTVGIFLISLWFFFFQHLQSTSVVQFWVYFIFIPCIAMLVATVSIDWLTRQTFVSDSLSEALSIILMIIICAIVIFTYNFSNIFLISLIIPIFISTVFVKTKLTLFTTSVALILTALHIFQLYHIQSDQLDEYTWLNGVATCLIIILAYFLSHIFLISGKNNNSVYLDKKSLEEKILLDPLTDLYDRRAYNDYIVPLLQNLSIDNNHTSTLTLALIDLDNFNLINQQYSEFAGDSVLQKIAHILLERLPNNTYPFRIGGDEIAIIFEGYSNFDVIGSIESYRAILKSTAFPEIKNHTVMLSAGIASLDSNIDRASELFQAAATALQQAKEQGKDQSVIYTPEMAQFNQNSFNINFVPVTDGHNDSDKRVVENNSMDHSFTKIKVSVLSDDPIFSTSLKQTIEKTQSDNVSLDIKTYADGETFLDSDWYLSTEQHIVIMEEIIPKKTAAEVLYQIRRLAKSNHITVYILTKRHSVEETIQAYETGADYVINVPLNMRLFMAEIKRTIERMAA